MRKEYSNADEGTRKMLLNIILLCTPSQTYTQAPRHVRFSLRDGNLFESLVRAEIIYIQSKHVLYVADKTT